MAGSPREAGQDEDCHQFSPRGKRRGRRVRLRRRLHEVRADGCGSAGTARPGARLRHLPVFDRGCCRGPRHRGSAAMPDRPRRRAGGAAARCAALEGDLSSVAAARGLRGRIPPPALSRFRCLHPGRRFQSAPAARHRRQGGGGGARQHAMAHSGSPDRLFSREQAARGALLQFRGAADRPSMQSGCWNAASISRAPIPWG
jgi:hypothetical protein